MKTKRKIFSIKYLRKGLWYDNEITNETVEKKKGKRRIKKSTLSTHIKIGKNWGKIK